MNQIQLNNQERDVIGKMRKGHTLGILDGYRLYEPNSVVSNKVRETTMRSLTSKGLIENMKLTELGKNIEM